MLENRYKYKNSDYNSSNLPKNRASLFFDRLTHHSKIMWFSFFMFFLFCLPLIGVSIIENLKINELSKLYILEDFDSAIFQLTTIYNLIKIPCIICASIGLCGMCSIFRKVIYDEIVIPSDFFSLIKKNYKSFIVLSFVYSILLLTLEYCLRNPDNSLVNRIAIIASIVVIVLFAPIVLFAISGETIYNLKLSDRLKNSFLLAMKTFFISLPVSSLFAAPLLIFLVSNYIVLLISLFVVPLIIIPLITLALMLFTDSVFDKYINKDNYKEIYRKGLLNEQD